MTRHDLRHEVTPEGVLFGLQTGRSIFSRPSSVSFDEWIDEFHPGVGLLKLLVNNGVAEHSNGRVLLGHSQIATLASAEIQALAMPPTCPYAIRLEAEGAFSDEQFSVRISWMRKDGAAVHGLRRIGSVLSTAAGSFTVREPLFGLVETIDRVNALSLASGANRRERLDERMVRLGRLTQALTMATGDASAERYLSRLTISHATGIGVDADGSRENPFFKPVLYGDVRPPPGAEDNEDVAVEREPLLPGAQADEFSERLFRRNGAWNHYRLREGVYVVLDKPVVAALKVVQKVNASDLNTRKRFRQDPGSFLLPEITAFGGTGDVLCGGTVLAPDDEAEYGSRVLGVAEWAGKAYSFKIPVNQQWFPPEDGRSHEELTAISIPGAVQPLVLPRSQIDEVISKVEHVARTGEKAFEHNGQTYPVERPAELLNVLRGLTGTMMPTRRSAAAHEGERESRKRLVLRVAENEDDLKYLAELRDPEGRLADDSEPDVPGLVSTPDAHQRDAIGWLKASFLSGMPGILLADDMGLGKTFQVLAFLHWLRRNEATDGRPTLIVAPAKLLDEWQEQIGIHLPPGALGRPVLAYDQGLRDITIERGSETDLGRAALDVERVRQADWVLTTYETLRDHQFSFAQVRFRVAIFDEAQKIKNSTSMLNHAAKAQQPDFVVLMTGTPIENSTMDIWTLLDVAWPGFLGISGKDFVANYCQGLEEVPLQGLKDRITSQQTWGEGDAARVTPPVMLRRFKTEILLGLPLKEERRWDEDMPPEQISAYDALLSEMQAGKLKPLAALQVLRQVCLHPELRTPRDTSDRRRLIESSARFRALFRVLREARDRHRAVLVFVDIRKAQDMLQLMIRDEFGLSRMPDVINGNTPSAAVADIKSRFQAGKGFGVLLLGPRSAGFGLTLTRATEVVHLNRWWNPAVEDQCSDRTHRKGQTQKVTIHLPIARHPQLGDESFDVVLDGMLRLKREQSRRVIVPSAMTEQELADFFSRLTGAIRSTGHLSVDELDRKDWRSFEVWVSGCFQAAGWQVNDTPVSGDAGADVICRHPKGGRPIVIQVKHRERGEGMVSDDAVEQVLASPPRYRNYPWLREPLLLVITNGSYDLRAQTLAAQREVQLVGRTDVTSLRSTAKKMLAADLAR